MNILQQIFNDHFNTVANSGITIRDTVFENVQKMLHCGDVRPDRAKVEVDERRDK